MKQKTLAEKRESISNGSGYSDESLKQAIKQFDKRLKEELKLYGMHISVREGIINKIKQEVFGDL